MSHGSSSFIGPPCLCMNLHTCFPASGCVTCWALFSPEDSKPSSSSASGANQVRSCSSLISGPFFISVTSGMMSLLLAAGPPVTSFCLGKFRLLHHLWQKCWRVCITKQKARWNRSRANWTLVFLDSPSKFPSLSSLLKELSSKAMKRLSTWGGVGGTHKENGKFNKGKDTVGFQNNFSPRPKTKSNRMLCPSVSWESSSIKWTKGDKIEEDRKIRWKKNWSERVPQPRPVCPYTSNTCCKLWPG